ncbi:hypothetical protein I317_06646 [Kwoniella heveanensis CBS 569]|nr:hypothetical protein I317_06646 [Kwoniella heveanensis CBS 569]
MPTTHLRNPSSASASTSAPYHTIPTLALPPSTKSLILPIAILIGIVVSSAAQTEFANHVSKDLGYDKPYFTFYLTHSTFTLIFPLHLLLLRLLKPGVPPTEYMDSIRHTLAEQLAIIPSLSNGHSNGNGNGSSADKLEIVTWREILPGWARKVTWLTLFLSIPAISWYIAMTLSPPVDITAIYATSSFATYGFSLLLLGTPLSKVTVGSIGLAFAGVVVISLDGMGSGEGNLAGRVIGDGVMLFGAIVLGLYEVVYKLALPEGHGGVSSSPSHHGSNSNDYSPLPTHAQHHSLSHSPLSSSFMQANDLDDEDASISVHQRPHFPHIPTDGVPTPIELTPPLSRTTSNSNAALLPSSNYPSRRHPHHHLHHSKPIILPPALHANFLTSCIGVATLLLLWPPVIALDWLGYEDFRWPGTGGGAEGFWDIWSSLSIVFWAGSLYNAGLMVLIGIWGPTTSSVANLLTIGLVALVDSLWLGQMPDFQTVIGVGTICVGFGVILWEGEG